MVEVRRALESEVAALAAQRAEAQLVLALSGAGRQAGDRWLQRCLGLGPVPVRPQGEGSLGLRMQRQLLRARRQGAEVVVMIGADLPALEVGELVRAFDLLEQHSLVLGPADDGGYWLIGQRAPFHAPLMAGIPWGGDRVLAATLAVAGAAGLTAELLSQHSDLDRRADLAPWA
jgi:rSAM/selenodomain-associated transferase 1